MIPFNRPPYEEKSFEYMMQAIRNDHICGDGEYTGKCSSWIEIMSGTAKCLMTTSCTHALEMAAFLLEVKEGDEVIMPSFTFASTADAFAMRGAKIIFVDIRPDTMNVDESLIESAITERTKVIVPVHYAGVACEMDIIMNIAKNYHLAVVEDAAQGVKAYYKGKALGSIGDFGCYSFHETKNYSMGEGGALLLQDKELIEKAEILREKGTNRSKFYRGEIDKYTWVDLGSSYLPSELNVAYLWGQLEKADMINKKRISIWNKYYEAFSYQETRGRVELPVIPPGCKHNAHMFYLKVEDERVRSNMIKYLNKHGIKAVFHYVPLHQAPSGKKYGEFRGEDKYTTKESERLLRLPLYQGLKEEEADRVIETVNNFFNIS